MCVITSEFRLCRYHLRDCGMSPCLDNLVGGRKLTDDEVSEISVRWKTLGSALSTARASCRLFDFVFMTKPLI